MSPGQITLFMARFLKIYCASADIVTGFLHSATQTLKSFLFKFILYFLLTNYDKENLSMSFCAVNTLDGESETRLSSTTIQPIAAASNANRPITGRSSSNAGAKPLKSSKTYTILVTKNEGSGTSAETLVESETITVSGRSPRKRNDGSQTSVNNRGFELYGSCSTKSNRAMIASALERSVFPGPPPGPSLRTEVLEALSSVPVTVTHFLILFRNAESCPYRGLYIFNPLTNVMDKIHGHGPAIVASDEAIDHFLKFNSASKGFEIVQTKHLSITIDAFTLPNSYWLGKKAGPIIKKKQNRFL